jgi:hypothetical protein
LSPKISLRWRWHCETILVKTSIVFRFSIGRLYIGEEASSGGGPGGLTPGGVARRGHATLGCGCPLAPLQLSFGLHPSSGKNRSFGLCFVQFQEYFLCSFFEHKIAENRELALWHIVNRLVS